MLTETITSSFQMRLFFCCSLLGLAIGTVMTASSIAAETDKVNQAPEARDKVNLRLNSAKQIQLTATISPVDFTRYGFHERWDELANLRAAVPRKTYPATAFEAFLPTKPIAVGETWEVGESVIQLIRQLHANATLKMHIDHDNSAGRWALLQSVSDRFAEIAFRIHADFPLEHGYVTFSQFTGRLVIDRVEGAIVFFRMFVPNTTINFDSNWNAGSNRGSITDAGRCRYVDLVSGHNAVADSIRWTTRVSSAKTDLLLARKLYPAWQIRWQPLARAHDLAKRFKRPIHVVSADGPFKDESC